MVREAEEECLMRELEEHENCVNAIDEIFTDPLPEQERRGAESVGVGVESNLMIERVNVPELTLQRE